MRGNEEADEGDESQVVHLLFFGRFNDVAAHLIQQSMAIRFINYVSDDGFARNSNFGMRHIDILDFVLERDAYPNCWIKDGTLNRSSYIDNNSRIFSFSSYVLKTMILEELLKKEFDTRRTFRQALGTQACDASFLRVGRRLSRRPIFLAQSWQQSSSIC